MVLSNILLSLIIVQGRYEGCNANRNPVFSARIFIPDSKIFRNFDPWSHGSATIPDPISLVTTLTIEVIKYYFPPQGLSQDPNSLANLDQVIKTPSLAIAYHE